MTAHDGDVHWGDLGGKVVGRYRTTTDEDGRVTSMAVDVTDPEAAGKIRRPPLVGFSVDRSLYLAGFGPEAARTLR